MTSVSVIDKTFGVRPLNDWNSDRAWMIELDEEIEVVENGSGKKRKTKTFVLSYLDRRGVESSIIFPTDHDGTPFKHYGVVGAVGEQPGKVFAAFTEEWLNLPPNLRATEQIEPFEELTA